MDLRFESGYRAAHTDQVHESCPTLRIDIHLGADVSAGIDELVDGIEPTDLSQGWIRFNKMPVGRGAKNSLDGVVEYSAVAALCLDNGLLGEFACGDVLNQSLVGNRLRRTVVHTYPAFPYPAQA